MEEVTLSETESRYFGDLFLCCDVEKTGKIPMLKAMELYRSANLSNDVLREITSLSGIPHTALHISRAQFYSCLKLIAAYQASMPLRQELIVASVQLPLPRFSWKESPSGTDVMSTSGTALNLLLHQSNGLNPIPPPVADRRNSLPRRSDWQESTTKSASGSRRNSSVNSQREQREQQIAQNSDVQSTDSEVEQNESSGGGAGGCTGSSSREARRRGSPEAWSTNSDSPTPTNSVAERPWAKETLWHGLLGDEHRQLLGTEEESSDRHSSDDENDTDLETVYQITPEQREYYFKQFKAVQHDPNGLLSGQVARVFFEKSRIPVEELRHIWQLCDVTRDGALSLAEFTAAMHLVVLRRNNIQLPAVLPACLYPSALKHSTLASQIITTNEPPEADLLHLNDDDDEENTDNTIINAGAPPTVAIGGGGARSGAAEKNIMNMSTISTSSQASTNSRQGITTLTPPPIPPSTKNRSISNSPNLEPSGSPPVLPAAAAAAAAAAAVIVKPKDRQIWVGDAPPTQWTKFTESPTSNVSSPGPKPVNFDMQRTAQAVVSDPQILHPVPLRVTPVAGSLAGVNEIHNTDSTVEPIRKVDNVIMRESTCDTSPKQTPNLGNNSSAANSSIHHRDSLQNNDLRAIQRPQAKKLPAKNIGAIPPPPQRESSIGSVGATVDELPVSVANNNTNNNNSQQQSHINKKEPPPLPPPRPRHGRSSSLDLNKFKMAAPSGQQPEIMTQASFDLQTTAGFADFTQFPDGSAASIHENPSDQQQQLYSLPSQQPTLNAAAAATTIPAAAALPSSRILLQSNQRLSAFEVYRKPSTPRSSQSPTTTTITESELTQSNAMQQPQQQQQQQEQVSTIPTHPPPPAPTFPTATSNATVVAHHLPNADIYEKRVTAISETLRHVSFKPDNNMADVLRHLREQNNLLLRLCNDLSDELLTVQTRKGEMRLKLEAVAATEATNAAAAASASAAVALTAPQLTQIARTGSSISAPVTANITGGSGSSGVHSNV